MKRKLTGVFTIILVLGSFMGAMHVVIDSAEAGTSKSGTIFSDETWTPTGSPYWIEGTVNVSSIATLTIEPGVEIRFDGFYSLNVWGVLNVVGTDTNPITITSNRTLPLPEPGDWDSIVIVGEGHAEIKYCRISYGDYGLNLVQSSGNNITNNLISDNNYGIYLETQSNYNVIMDNIIQDNIRYGISLWSSSHSRIENNSFFNDGIFISGDQLSHFNSHIIPENNMVNGKSLFYIKDSNGLNIDGMVLGQLILVNCTGVDVRNLQIDDTDVGIEVAYSTNTNIKKNSFLNNDVFGVALLSSYDSMIINNNVSSNGWYGISMWSSSDNKISNNEASLNNFVGLSFFLGSSNNIAYENNLSTNNYGIYIDWWSSANRFYHNNFIDNSNQALDAMNDNIWDDGYPSGGNYWSDYTGDDASKGMMQDIQGGDGIGDDPYVFNVDPDSNDVYPLIAPYHPGASPSPPENLSAHLSGFDNGNVTLSWTLSDDDDLGGGAGGGEGDVFGYTIHYSEKYNAEHKDYNYLDFVPNGTSSYVIPLGTEGNLEIHKDYYYHVEAWALDRAFNTAERQAAKLTLSMQPGLNLISIPLLQSDESTEVVLQTLGFDLAWSYVNTDFSDPWKSFNIDKPSNQNDLDRIGYMQVLWLNVTGGIMGAKGGGDNNLTVAGGLPGIANVDLSSGWNLVGYPSLTERTVYDALNGITYDRVEGFTNSPVHYLKIYDDGDTMTPWSGYWIKVPYDQTWTLINE